MPTYDYKCENCGSHTEAFHKISDPPLKRCDTCGKEALVRKPGGGIGLAFTGDGFYSTMYGKEDKRQGNTHTGGCCPCGKNKGACEN